MLRAEFAHKSFFVFVCFQCVSSPPPRILSGPLGVWLSQSQPWACFKCLYWKLAFGIGFVGGSDGDLTNKNKRRIHAPKSTVVSRKLFRKSELSKNTSILNLRCRREENKNEFRDTSKIRKSSNPKWTKRQQFSQLETVGHTSMLRFPAFQQSRSWESALSKIPQIRNPE